MDRHRSSNHGSALIALVGVLATVSLVAAACTDSDEADESGDDGPFVAEVVSTRAETVTGGDVLIGVSGGTVDSVEVNERAREVDFTESERAEGDPAPMSAYGLVTDLPDGASTITVTSGDDSVDLDVVNHPVAGPVFSGERLPMTVCTTDRFNMAESTPPECDAESTTSFAYVDSDDELTYIDDPADVPDDAATVTVDGEERPAVLRVENGVINRGIYTIATLAPADVAADDLDEWDDDTWNGRLIYRFGGGCGTTFGQGFDLFGSPSMELLSEGYAFATNTLNTFQVQCQDILSAETAMMTKEHFVENYGVPVVTIGEGGSGGAIQQLLVAQNYPGILDAIAPSLPFPDAVSISPGVVDCALLQNYYRSPEGAGWTPEQQAAANGHANTQTCTFWEQTFVPVIDPTKCGFGDAVSGTGVDRAIPGLAGGLASVPEDELYDPDSNPDGIRCTFQDSYPQIFAIDEETGFRDRPVDNVGVQYGLNALNAGTITPEQFVSLNENVGGFDLDANPIPERMAGSTETIERLYESGRVVEGGPLYDVPILAFNVYTDDEGDIHDRMRMFSLDERLKDDDGNQAPNYVMWTRPSEPEGDLLEQLSGSVSVGARATRLLDEWATAVAADDSEDPLSEKVERARPIDGENTCFDLEGAVVDTGPEIYDEPGPCNDPFPLHDDPRTASGAPLRNDIAKCRLQSIDDAVAGGVYAVDLGPALLDRLRVVFADGVCDWAQPGQAQVPLGEPWQDYG